MQQYYLQNSAIISGQHSWQTSGLMRLFSTVLLLIPVSLGEATSFSPLETFPVSSVSIAADQNVSLTAERRSPMLQVNASLFKNGDWVEAQWSGVQDPGLDDIIAIFAPADADVSKTVPVKYIWAIQSPSHMSSGYGSYRFRLVNMRKSLRFALLQSRLGSVLLRAYSTILHPENPDEPLQIHMALTGKLGEMLLQWTSLNEVQAHAQWGKQPGEYSQVADSASTSYTREDMCGYPANGSGWSDPGLLHQALLTGLEPSTRYYYRVGDPELGFSEEHSFLTPPEPAPDAHVKFLAIADLGQAEVDGCLEESEMAASLNTTARLAAETDYHQLLIHNGDISYARGYQTIWDAYWDQMTPLTTRMPYMMLPGNHERDWPNSGDRFHGGVYDSGGECGVAFERRSGMPLPGNDKWWYSFEFGPIHFLQYSTEHDFAPGSEQHNFVVADLESVNRSVTPWLVVGGHRPFLVDSTYGSDNASDVAVSKDLQDAFDDLFFQHGVDMTWHGHHHSYQRSCPYHKGACHPGNPDGTQRAPIHLVIGHAGAGLSYTVHQQRPSFMEVVLVEHGYMRVEATGTRLYLEVIGSCTGRLMDRLELKKSAAFQATAEM